MIKNFGHVIEQLKWKLEPYLNSQGIKTNSKLFRCPNKEAHNHQDAKPSCNFFPDKKTFKCFACEYRKGGDIFDAVHLLEKRDITGENFTEVVKYLCDKFNVPYEVTTTEEDKFLHESKAVLQRLVSIAHARLKYKLKTDNRLKNFLKHKGWIDSIDVFKLGFFDEIPILDISSDVLQFLRLENLNSLINRIIIPIYSWKNQIIGITCRSINPDEPSKYKHFLLTSLHNTVFNLNNVDGNKPVYIVEGPSSVLTLYRYNITNVVATFGNHLHNNQLTKLIKSKVKDIILMYDGDTGGDIGVRNSLLLLSSNNKDFNTIKIAKLPSGKDPGEVAIEKNGLNLQKIQTVTLLDYLYNKYKESIEDKVIERALMQYINSIEDVILKEKIINDLSKKIKINKTTLNELLKLYQYDNTTISVILEEKNRLIQTINDFERWAWSRGELLGLRSFKSFDKYLDGIQPGLVLIAGRPNAGKSATQISLAIKILQNNPDVYLAYFTLDDSVFTTVARFVANLAHLPINVVSNPNYKIEKANLPDSVKQSYTARREKALEFIRQHASVFNISGESVALEAIQERIKVLQKVALGRKIVVFIDNLHNIRSKKYMSDKTLYSNVSNELNSIANNLSAPVIASTHVTKESIKNNSLDGTSIKESVDLYFDAKLIISVDLIEDPTSENVQDDMPLDLYVVKNKMSGFKGSLPFIFYRSYSKIEERDLAEGGNSDIFS